MNDSTRSILHEVMEQQTVSVAKAGIICSLNARTSILASANPVNSRYDPHMSVVENIQLPPTLLSRFDLIYLVLDKPNPETDRQLAKHLVSLYYDPSQAREKDDEELFTISQVAQYISYARANVRPRISNEAVEELVDGECEGCCQGLISHSRPCFAGTQAMWECAAWGIREAAPAKRSSLPRRVSCKVSFGKVFIVASVA